MNDHELLELAAKAAGIGPVIGYKDGYLLIGPESFCMFWNPLEDDGEALRLANRLNMMVSTGPCEAKASTIAGTLRGHFPKECTIGKDQDAAVRRAIVRAAAEIGRAMP